MHGTADTSIHPQHSMMLVRGVMQQQQQYTPNSIDGKHGRRNNSSTSEGRISNGSPFKVGAIRISQLALPDVDLSNMRMATGVKNGSPVHHQHQLLHSIYSHVTQYLATECFTSVRDGSRGRGIKVRGRALRKRRRRRWRTGNRDQEDLDDQQQQLQRDEYHQQHQKNQRSISNNDNTSGGNGRDHNNGGRYRRHNIDNNHYILENKSKNDMNDIKIKTDDNGFSNNNKSNSVNWSNSFLSTPSSINNNKSNKISNKKTQEKNDYTEKKDEGIENDDGSNDDYNNNKKYKEKDKKEKSDNKK